MKQFAKKFYKSKAWHDCRAAFFKGKFGLCEQCGAAGVIVHHKTKLMPQNINDPNVTLNWDNLELLCLDCHNREHGVGSTAEGTKFDADGNLIKTYPPILKYDKIVRDRAGVVQKPRQSPIKP